MGHASPAIPSLGIYSFVALRFLIDTQLPVLLSRGLRAAQHNVPSRSSCAIILHSLLGLLILRTSQPFSAPSLV